MSCLRNFVVGTAIFACAGLSSFAARAASSDDNRASFNGEQAARALLLAGGNTASASTVQAKELVANSYREYPASCLSNPLPTTPGGTLYGGTVTLYATNSAKVSSAEDVTITVWRVPCSSSGSKPAYNPDGGPAAATLMRIQRQTQYEGSTTLYPTFPSVRISQGSIGFDNANNLDFVRVAPEPNTVVSDTLINAPIIKSATFVLESYPDPSRSIFAFNSAFNIRFDNGYTDISGQPSGQVVFAVADYSPTSSTYPAAFQPLPINGYLTGSWYDTAHGGEGILTQVLENPDDATRTFIATWYTFDQSGLPFWLIAQGSFSIGATQVQNMPVFYLTGGGFAGDFTSPTTTTWGTMSVQFTDCNTMKFSYNGTAAAVKGPVGNDSRTWSRIGTINSLTCE